MGYLATFYLSDVFNAALNEIATAKMAPGILLSELKAEEDSEYQELLNSVIPKELKKFLLPDDVGKVNITLFGKGKSFCHTAKLPAEIRHKGVLTESNQTGFTTYDKGMPLREADSSVNDGELMRLVYDESDRFDCPVTTIMDYKDFFYLHERDQWKKLILPNDSEMREYGSPGQELQGMILMCYKLCDWGKCPVGALGSNDFQPGKFEMKVNGASVSNLTKVQDCDLLTNPEGVMWKPNPDGKFEIMAKIAEPNSYIRLSSFIIW